MSLITRCPACATLFRVVPDQLKVAEGWVRCGQCAEVFDASSQLQPAFTAQAADDAAITAPAPLEAQPHAEPDHQPYDDPDPEPDPQPHEPAESYLQEIERELAAARHRPIDLLLDEASAPAAPAAPDQDGSRLVPADDAEPDIEEIVALAADDSRWPWPPHEPEGIVFRAPPASEDDKREPRLEPEPLGVPGETEGPLAPPASAPAPGFVQQARRRAFWRSRGVRATLALLSVALAVLLLGQFALHHRNALAALQPDLTPLLEGLCRPLGCRVGPPRQIEAIVIDGSSFSRVRPDAFRLGVTLRSRSIMALEMPALELTLTDAEDRPVLRRVLLAADLGAGAPDVLLPGAEWSTALTVGITPGTSAAAATAAAPGNPAGNAANGANGANAAAGLGARITGYRLLAFYP